ncbi:hypothetical protein D2T31_19685 [Sinirhodobacter populi]|uniref:VPLPA-CTERM sorting domain-containing protein n=1 Tax=Paenirhodobacter populi TaxID=2306993 RepID=A0A443K191_9RHOB|nr:hypothetical protein [Sinirhodobacter populi]RWR26518.1 hypothetical protein D2T31_19685 [Sinirhodobacter populi]
MIMKMQILAAAAVATVLPFASQAATVTTGLNSDLETLRPTDSYAETWSTNGNTYAISTISFTVNGTGALAATDIPNVYVSVDGKETEYNNWTVVPFGSQTIGYLFLEGFTTSSDFTITMDYKSGSTVLLATYAFTAEEVPLPAVPVPAAGILLVSALAGLGAAAKRRRNKA